MIGMQLLKDKIDKSGYKLRYIAEQLGISYQGLLNKLNSDTEFKASEIYILYHLLNMSETERDNIFLPLILILIPLKITKNRNQHRKGGKPKWKTNSPRPIKRKNAGLNHGCGGK